MNTQIQGITFRIIDNNIHYLLLKRKKNKGDFWQPICGRLKKGESHLQGVFREVYEETGIIRKEILRIIPQVYHFEMNNHYLTNEQIPKVVEYVYGVEVHNLVQVDITKNQSYEHEDFIWVDYRRAMKMLKWKDNKIALEKLNTIIDQS